MENRKVKVKVTHLAKKFGDLLVLNDVSFAASSCASSARRAAAKPRF